MECCGRAWFKKNINNNNGKYKNYRTVVLNKMILLVGFWRNSSGALSIEKMRPSIINFSDFRWENCDIQSLNCFFIGIFTNRGVFGQQLRFGRKCWLMERDLKIKWECKLQMKVFSIFFYIFYLMKLFFYIQSFVVYSTSGWNQLDCLWFFLLSAKGAKHWNMKFVRKRLSTCVWIMKNNLGCNCKLIADCWYYDLSIVKCFLLFLFFDLCFNL